MINALLMPGAILGQFYLLLCSLNIHTRVRKSNRRIGESWKEKRKKKGGGQKEKKWERKERLAFFFFFDVFAFTTSKFSLIPSVHNRASTARKSISICAN